MHKILGPPCSNARNLYLFHELYLYSLNFKYSNKMFLKFDSLILPLLNLNIPLPRFKSLKGIDNIFQNISQFLIFLDYEFTYFSSTPRCVRNDKKMYNLCAIYMSVSIDGRWKPILCEIARRICSHNSYIVTNIRKLIKIQCRNLNIFFF